MIFIPRKIKVGYQERHDTYTKKLAYVIYYDDKGKLRKENSWEGWRSKKITHDDFDNEPTSGFVLNKSAGGVSYSRWDSRKSYCRVYDPRGFEIEIGIDNLLYILENTNSIVGKGLEGEFVYGWSGTELALIPISSPDYSEIMEKTDILFNKEFLKAKDLESGRIYEDLDGKKYVYIGRREIYDYQTKTGIAIKEDKQYIFFDLGGDGDIRFNYLKDSLNKNDQDYYFKWALKIVKTLPQLIESSQEYHPRFAEAMVLAEKHRVFTPIKGGLDIYKKTKTTPKDLENYRDLKFLAGRNTDYYHTGISETTEMGVKHYKFNNSNRYSYYRNNTTRPAEEFIKHYWLKTLIKI